MVNRYSAIALGFMLAVPLSVGMADGAATGPVNAGAGIMAKHNARPTATMERPNPQNAKTDYPARETAKDYAGPGRVPHGHGADDIAGIQDSGAR
jgi:hypothetical protein